MPNTHPLIQPPRLHRGDGHGHRRASWLELFFDLVFVVAVAELAHLLNDDLTPHGVLIFAALFVPVWWQWIDFSYFADQFDTGESVAPALSQVITLLVMFAVLILALTIHKVPHHHSEWFAGVYALLRVVIIALYLWAWRTVDESRELTGRYALSFTIALIFWIASLFVPEPTRFVLWGVALCIEIFNGPVTYATLKHVPQQVSHMDERFGLFILIVLGETVVSVATGVSGTPWGISAFLTGFAGFVVACGMWRMYFVRADETVINRALRGGKRDLVVSFIYGYSHLLAFIGIVAAGIGVQSAIETPSTETLTLGAQIAAAGGAATFLLGVALLQWATPRSLPLPVLASRLAGAALCVALIPAGAFLPPLAFVAVLVAVLAALILHESFHARLTYPDEPELAAGPA